MVPEVALSVDELETEDFASEGSVDNSRSFALGVFEIKIGGQGREHQSLVLDVVAEYTFVALITQVKELSILDDG